MKKKTTILLLLLSFAITLQAQIFYKIEKDGHAPSYILGTHHLAPLATVESIPSIAEAFKECGQIVGEIDMTPGQMALAMEIQPYMMAPADSTLSKVISPDDFKRISAEFAKWAPMPGMELSMLEPMKPIVVTNIVSIGVIAKNLPGYNPEEQLDSYFQNKGKSEGKKIKGLETAAQQAEILYNFYPISKQAENLVELLDKPQELIEQAQSLNDVYARHDIDALLKMSIETDSDPEFMERLLDKRNADWIVKLPAIIDADSSFIAVGALHLPGEKGVLEGLRKAGYKITPLK